MSSDLFDRNLSKLVRQAALPDGAAAARARFLREAESAPASRSRVIAVAAAALLIGTLIYGAARTERPAAVVVSHGPARPAQTPAGTEVTVGNDLLQVTFKAGRGSRATKTSFELQGRTSKLPDGLVLRIRMQWLAESFDGRRLVPRGDYASQGTRILERGALEMAWEDVWAGSLQIDVSTPDDLQDREVLSRLKMKESDRTWSFTFQIGDERLLPRVDAQLAELADLIREAQALVDRARKESALEEHFRANAKSLADETNRLLERLKRFSFVGLYPAGTSLVLVSLHNLRGALPNVAFKEGKFAGAPDYHQMTPGNKVVPFSFDGLREGLDLASLVAGREFDLWILRDLARGGPRPEINDAVKRHAQRPGVIEFAIGLLIPGDPNLMDEIRSVVK